MDFYAVLDDVLELLRGEDGSPIVPSNASSIWTMRSSTI